MCISLPGKIVKIDGNNAVVSYGKLGESTAQNLIKARVGDYVYVTQKMVVNLASKDEFKNSQKEV